MAVEKKTSKAKNTKSTAKRTSTKTKGAKSTAKRTPTAKTGSKSPAKRRSATKKEANINSPAVESKTSDKSKEKSFLVDAAEHIDEGTKLVKDKTAELATDIAKKAVGFKDTLFDKVKKGVSEAYEASSKAIEELTETAQEYGDKYKHKIEINKLKAKQEKQFTKLGSLIFDKYKVIGISADKLFKEKDIKELINEIENTAKQIVEQGKTLDKSSNESSN